MHHRIFPPAVLLTTFIVVRGAVAQTSIAITHVTVIDMTGAAPHPDQTVVIQGNRIVSVRRGSAPAGSTIIEGKGKFLIPGLWDMHVHTTVPGGETLLSLFVVNGVTGVRDMNDSFSVVQQWRPRSPRAHWLGRESWRPDHIWRVDGSRFRTWPSEHSTPRAPRWTHLPSWASIS